MGYRENLDITYATATADFCLRLTFSDGTFKEVYVRDLLEGHIFQPLQDPDYFRLVKLDPECGTVVWPNGADIAPEALWDLPDLATV